MSKIVHVVGARPNFMKIAPIISALGAHPAITQRLVHTGQHYDHKMAHVFFDEELEPDAVRLLARRSCTAWVRTRTNMVRESIVERLGRFGGSTRSGLDDGWGTPRRT